jgi:hypothetical protein
VLAYWRSERAVFLYGFAKSARANIDDDELAALKRRGAGLLRIVGILSESLAVEPSGCGVAPKRVVDAPSPLGEKVARRAG